VTQFQGSTVSEVRTQCGWLALTVRLVNNEDYAEFEFQTGSVPIHDGIGKEVITRFSTAVRSDSLYYTDSNGREYQTRKRNFRPTWNLTVTEPIAGNYYPVNTGAFIRDASQQFSVLNDRSQGGGSINDGQFELMIHRRLLWDDARGVGEPLNETDSITPYPNPVRIGDGLHCTGSHFVYMNTPQGSLSRVRGLQSRIFQTPQLGFTPLTGSVQNWISTYKVEQSWIKTELPINVEVMTLQNLGNGENLLRLSHQFGIGEDAKYSSPVSVDLSSLFTFPLSNVKEVSLTTNQDVAKMTTLQWQTEENEDVATAGIIPFDGASVTINPIDVRTFVFTK